MARRQLDIEDERTTLVGVCNREWHVAWAKDAATARRSISLIVRGERGGAYPMEVECTVIQLNRNDFVVREAHADVTWHGVVPWHHDERPNACVVTKETELVEGEEVTNVRPEVVSSFRVPEIFGELEAST